jgi:hypothetical protein
MPCDERYKPCDDRYMPCDERYKPCDDRFHPNQSQGRRIYRRVNCVNRGHIDLILDAESALDRVLGSPKQSGHSS